MENHINRVDNKKKSHTFPEDEECDDMCTPHKRLYSTEE